MALTLTQPYASLIAWGHKRIETRNWSTPYRGPLAIHAAKGFPAWAEDACFDADVSEAMEANHVHRPGDLPRGVVVATARLVGCVATGPRGSAVGASVLGVEVTPEEHAFGDFGPGRWLWVLADVATLERPIPARGALGLWNWSGPPALAAFGGAR